MILGDFNFCEPEKGRFSVRNQIFTEADAGKTPLFNTVSIPSVKFSLALTKTYRPYATALQLG